MKKNAKITPNIPVDKVSIYSWIDFHHNCVSYDF